jgi:Zn-dependent M28 family amino/carboxypeptidase
MSATVPTDCINNLKRHVHVLADEIGERNVRKHSALHEAANYISNTWEAMGYSVERQSFGTKRRRCDNLEVTIRGREEPDNILLICAHYDSAKDSPGANDASGIATLLELSRAFQTTAPKCSVRFVALCNEKPPYAGTAKSGSWIYAHHARQREDKIKAAIVLESLGYYNNAMGSQMHPALMGPLYPRQANFISMTSNLASMPVMRSFSRLFKKHSRFNCKTMIAPNLLPWVKWSDNSPFWTNGFKAFMVSDTSLYRYPFYNSSRDTAEKIDYQCLALVTDGLMKAVTEYTARQKQKNPA